MSSFDLPQIDFHLVADQAMNLPAVRALVFGSYGVVALGVMVRYAKEMFKPANEAQYWRPFVAGVFWMAVLFSYSNLTTKIITVVMHLGDSSYQKSADDLQTAFVGRISGFLSDLKSTKRKVAKTTIQNAPGTPSTGKKKQDVKIPDPTPSTGGFAREIGVMLVQLFVWGCYLLVLIVVFLLRALQMYMLGIIASYGPLLLSFASLGGIFHPLGLAWFWGLVEVSAWSITYHIIFRFVSKYVPERAPETINFAAEIMLCAMLVFLFKSVPKITAMLLRNESGSGLAIEMRMASVASAARVLKTGGGLAGSAAAKTTSAAKSLYARIRR